MNDPTISWVMPCYNEEQVVAFTVRRLVAAFARGGHTVQLVAVDNGSTDRTGAILADLAREHPEVQVCRVEQNRGYGNGILAGLRECRGAWVGIVAADGQVDAEDVVRLFEAALAARGPVLAKVRRRFRMDGLGRKVISVGYNTLVRCLWPRLQSIDVNGTPKILPRPLIERMQLESRGWFLDPEIMIKAHYMETRVLEFNVFARMRGSGTSHVRVSTCWEFLRELLAYRFSRRLVAWRQAVRQMDARGSAL
jgi:glycosyltransferase involved in cell wall biosynthesis